MPHDLGRRGIEEIRIEGIRSAGIKVVTDWRIHNTRDGLGGNGGFAFNAAAHETYEDPALIAAHSHTPEVEQTTSGALHTS